MCISASLTDGLRRKSAWSSAGCQISSDSLGRRAVPRAMRLFMAASLAWSSSGFGWHPEIRKHFHLGLSHVLIRSKLQLACKPGDTLS